MADVSVGDVRFNVVQLGPPAGVERSSPPVVFIHGLIMDDLSSFYFTLAPPVALKTEVLCYDLRGHGLSERPPDGYRLEDAVADLCGILDAVGFTEPVQLVGNSFGGTIALSATLWAPERVASLVLIEANPAFAGWGDTMVEDLEDLVEGFDGPGIRGYIAAGAPRKLRKMVDRCEQLVTKTSLPDDLRASRPTTIEDLAAVACPSLLLYGDASDILDHGLTLAEYLPATEMQIIEGCSHALLMEAPEDAAALVVPWLVDADRSREKEPASWSRVMIVVPPLVGHVNPTIPLGCELAARGHNVVWAGLPGIVDPLLPAGARFVPVRGGLDGTSYAALTLQGRGLRGAEALKFLWEDFVIPLAQAMVPEIEAAIDTEQPDLLVVDQQAVGAAAVARRRGVRWVTSASTSAELTDPLAALPRVNEWVHDQLQAIQVAAGIDPGDAGNGDLRFSDELVIAFTTRALAGDPEVPGIAPRVRFVGPCLESRPESAPFDWDWLDPARPLVLVSLGTVNAEVGARFFGVVVEALSDAPLQAVLVAPPDLVDLAAAGNIRVAARVPQLALLARSSAVVTHGGHNTVCEALAQSLPLVLAPIRDDQPIVAGQVVRAGAGIRVRFGRVKPPELRAAVEQVLTEPTARDAAARIARSFTEAGGARAAADAVEACLRERVR